MPNGFRLGDFQFFDPTETAPWNRKGMRPDEPLRGATAPDWLTGLVRDAKNSGPAALLWSGEWRGHGEPGYAVYDVVVAGSDTVELALLQNEGEGSKLLIRLPGKDPWTILHATSWFRMGEIPSAVQTAPAAAASPNAGPNGKTAMRVAIGFEYPIDCSSQNEVSWVAFAAQEPGGAAFVLGDEELY